MTWNGDMTRMEPSNLSRNHRSGSQIEELLISSNNINSFDPASFHMSSLTGESG
jgi:hypothetical protein